MTRHVLVFALMLMPVASVAQDKEVDCRYQGQVAGAVAQARVDRVPEAQVADVIRASNPGWPEQYNNAIPALAQHFYQMPRRVLRRNDMGALFEQQCLQNWDQIQDMKNALGN